MVMASMANTYAQDILVFAAFALKDHRVGVRVCVTTEVCDSNVQSNRTWPIMNVQCRTDRNTRSLHSYQFDSDYRLRRFEN